jgi:DNA/RNA endonuclease G (NUC1)
MGSVGEVKKVGKLSIPTHCWKVIYVKRTNEFYAWIFPNIVPTNTKVTSYEVKVVDVEKITKLKFIAK